MGNPFSRPNVVVSTPPPPKTITEPVIKLTTKPTTKPTTPTHRTFATTQDTTTSLPTTAATTSLTTSAGLVTLSTMHHIERKSQACCNTPITKVTSSDFSTPPLHDAPLAIGTDTPTSSATRLPSYLLPLAIVMSTSFLIIAFILLVIVVRRRHHTDKQDETELRRRSPVLPPRQIFSIPSRSMESSLDCVYVEHGERDSKNQDGFYTYVTKPSIMGGLPRGYAPSVGSPKKVFRGSPDGKIRTLQATTCFGKDAFGDEDHYNLLFEDTPSVVNVLVMNSYENHQPNGCYQNYVNVTEIPEKTTEFLDAPPTVSDDSSSIKSGPDSMKRQDPPPEAMSVVSHSDPPKKKSTKTSTVDKPNEPSLVKESNDPEVKVEIQDGALYENTPRSREGTVKSAKGVEPKYYVLEPREADDVDESSNRDSMVENILYQSITE